MADDQEIIAGDGAADRLVLYYYTNHKSCFTTPVVGFKECLGGPAPVLIQRRQSTTGTGATGASPARAPWASGHPQSPRREDICRVSAGRGPRRSRMNMVSYRPLRPPLSPHPSTPRLPALTAQACQDGRRGSPGSKELLLPGPSPPQHPGRERLHPSLSTHRRGCRRRRLAIPMSSRSHISLRLALALSQTGKQTSTAVCLSSLLAEGNMPFRSVLIPPREGAGS